VLGTTGPTKVFFENPEETIKLHKKLGCKDIGIGGASCTTLAQLNDFIKEANAFAKLAKKAGLTFSYHNHSYEFELLHTDSEQMCYFTMRIDNTPPEAVLVGAEDGGVTRENVTIEQLKNGDMIYVYKDGAGWKTYFVDGESETVLDLLGNSDFGSYSVVIEDEAGNVVRYEFVKEFATNTYSNVFICLLLISFGAIGIIYIRFNGKVRTK
jgi:hypothetical protein